MNNLVARRRSVLSVLFAVLLLVLAASAQAAVWVGSWDPKFGSPFQVSDGFTYDLGWGGEIKVNDDACTVTPGATISNSADCGGGAFVVPGSVFVRLYQHPNLTPILNTLSFNASTLTIDELRYDMNGKLTGISTSTLSNWVADTVAGTGADFRLQFVLDGEPCLNCTEFGLLPLDYDGPVLFARIKVDPECDPEFNECFYNRYRSNVADFPANLRFTPEPASSLLIAGALMAAAYVRRRQSLRAHGLSR